MKTINFFNLSYLLYLMALFVQQVNINNLDVIKQILVMLSMTFLILYLCASKFSIANFISYNYFFNISFAFAFLVSIYTKDYFMIAILLFTTIGKYFKYNIIFKYTYITMGISSASVFLLSLLGFLPNDPFVRDMYSGYGYGETRYAFGFMWPLVLPNTLVFITLYSTIVNNKINLWSSLIIQLLGFILLYYCDARSGFISLQLTFFFYIIYNYISTHKNRSSLFLKGLICLFSRYVFIIIAVVSLSLLYLYVYGYDFGYAANLVLSNRLKWAALSFDSYPPNLLNISDYSFFKDAINFTVDNGYFYVVLRYGYLSLALLSFLCYKLSLFFEKQGNFYGLITIIVISIMNFIDNNITSYGFFPLLLLGLINLKNKIDL